MCIVIYGHKYKFEPIGTIDYPCPGCKQSPVTLSWARKKATIYFIPTFTMEQSYAIGCGRCNEHWTIPAKVGEELLMALQ
jgi:hypothetical protein